TVHLGLALLSHLFEVARSAWGMESLVNPVPLAKTARPKLPQGRDRHLRPGEEEKLLAAARAYGGDIASIIHLALETAMRRGEIYRMKWEHVDRAAAGIEGLRFHDLRHEATSRFFEKGL
ncbi:phage integrase family protein, partial [mine drainage metagenome]